ncbi:hypothetical protein IRY61_06535 [Candidatus Saccharibacteria bacterium]|nr:hypothetical protein [Candidatus Saccharibacteria bacterium]
MAEKLISDSRVIDENQPPVIVITGPTGCGKTGAAASLGPNTEAVCADSCTAWTKMDIGTAKPPPEIRVQYRIIYSTSSI